MEHTHTKKKEQETVELFHSFVVAFLLFQLLFDDGEETSSSIHRKWVRARGLSFFYSSIDGGKLVPKSLSGRRRENSIKIAV